MKVSSVIQFIYAEVRRSIPGLEWCVCIASPVLNQKLSHLKKGNETSRKWYRGTPRFALGTLTFHFRRLRLTRVYVSMYLGNLEYLTKTKPHLPFGLIVYLLTNAYV